MARPSAEGGFLMICQFCEYEFPDGLGKYGCPNCYGEGLDEDESEGNSKQEPISCNLENLND
jgi:hypothetical protein